ncbi:LysR substrate-binding domain-containing protein [Burkholderia vietnamiensis]|uniref:LysR substrate-binding domain-containing protein n=1 Tax=Burkholderia vietnamiensis TaxID=60552 RepID=UPI0009BFA51D|nr:LysR substrate-binding domain-containing protein [Burkholderia vietnamiensis]
MNEMSPMTIGEMVRMARNGLSQKAFADLLGVRQSTVSRYESGRASPPAAVVDTCMRLVHELNAQTSDKQSRKIEQTRIEATAAHDSAPPQRSAASSPNRRAVATGVKSAARAAREPSPRKPVSLTILDPRWSIFLSVAMSGSFSRAASALDMPQSMVSRSIAQLETQCGERLFRRTGRGVVLSEFGEQTLPRVASLKADAEALADSIRSVKGQPVGEVRVGLLPTAVKRFAGPLFAAARKQFPGVRLHLTEGASSQLEEHLREGRLDMALVLREEESAIRDGHVVARIPLHLVGLRGEAPVGAPEVPLAMLSGLRLVVPSRPHLLRARLDRLAAEHALTLDVAVEADSVGLQYAVASAGGGFAIASVLPGLLGDELASARIVQPELERFVVLVESPRRPATRATQAVKRLLLHVAESQRAYG